jgi:hypothetical protein
MSLHGLARHPDTPCTAIVRIDVELGRDARGLRLCYRMLGDATRVVVAPRASDESRRRCDGLWRSTCCELFLRDPSGPGYREYNFAPCGDWAAYRFSSYRSGMAPLDTRAPIIALERSPAVIALTVTLTETPPDTLDDTGRIGLACVVETDAGLCYWALAHPAGEPDFHHASAFGLTPAIDRSMPSSA